MIAAGPFASVSAQRIGPAPKRPRIESADTNDARAYFDYGLRNMRDKPSAAADAFYWAARIEPGMADALYGRRVALLMSDDGQLRRFMSGNIRNPNKKDLHLDSLMLRSVMLSPLLLRRFELPLMQGFILKEISGGFSPSERPSDLELNSEIERYLREGGPEMRGAMAYARSDFKNALSHYAAAMKGAKETARLRIERGRIFGIQGQPDSAVAEFQLALTELRKKDAKEVVVLYNSKAVVEQAIGMMLEQKEDVAGAREAYGRALQEDLAYWPAHTSLGMLAAAVNDTATALSEFALAMEIASDESYVHALTGSALVNLGRPAEAIAPLKKAIALEPYYALPHIALGKLYEGTKAWGEAIASYEGFLTRAGRNDPQRAFAEERLAALKGRLLQ
ncbi:MAG: hypothetical protein H7Z40_05085 [Phycisphaerae bacterium]|nr:hypothetical protein [Gemmatimonadaceae bacterium]